MNNWLNNLCPLDEKMLGRASNCCTETVEELMMETAACEKMLGGLVGSCLEGAT